MENSLVIPGSAILTAERSNGVKKPAGTAIKRAFFFGPIIAMKNPCG
jgi:hypothetical protein